MVHVGEGCLPIYSLLYFLDTTTNSLIAVTVSEMCLCSVVFPPPRILFIFIKDAYQNIFAYSKLRTTKTLEIFPIFLPLPPSHEAIP